MAKQKDHGDLLEIYFDEARDSLRKFQKIIRKVIVSEHKDILIRMANAPALSRDYLASLVFGAKALKAHGHSVTIVLSLENYAILKDSENAGLFQFEVEADDTLVADPAAPPSELLSAISPYFSIDSNTIVIAEEGADEIAETLPSLIQSILDKGHREVVVDLTEFFLLTPEVIQTMILETLNSGNALKIRIGESMKEIIESNPQATILNIEIDSGSEAQADLLTEETLDDEAISSARPDEDDSNFPLENEREASIPAPQQEPLATSVQDDGTPSDFRIDVNCLRAGVMTPAAFLRDFPVYFKRLFRCGDQLYLDLSEYDCLEIEVISRLILANFEAVAAQKKLTINLLKDQHELMTTFLPRLNIVERTEDTTPRFIIVGSRMELHHVDTDLFLDKFSEHFKKLMGSGHSNLVVDISHLKEFTERSIQLMVLCYLEAVGRGISLTIRIRPEMEENFLKSGRGKTLPLELVKPELTSKMPLQHRKEKASIDMSKIKAAMMEGDRLSEKVITKKYESVHIESRGTFQNWEPAPIKADEKEDAYFGPERRVDKRYKVAGIEVIFARGSIAKISGRRYQVHNLSHGGICFTCAVSLSRNEPLRLKIFCEDASIEVGAKVIWAKPIPSQALFRTGVQFTKISDFAKAQLRDFIRKSSKDNS